MGGPKGLYKSNKKKKPDIGNRIVNVPQRPVQPIGNEAFMNDDLIAHAGRHPMRGGGKGKPSSIPNQSMNIMNIENDDLDGFERNEDGEILIAGKDNSEKPTPFTGKIKSMGLEELRALFLKVHREGDSALDGLGDLYGTRRAYDFEDYELSVNKYNPGESNKLEAVQKSIDDAKDPTQAYKAFMKFAGNEDAQLLKKDKVTEWKVKGIKLDRFKAKLKQMVRVVHDYPELIGRIGDMQEITGLTNLPTMMAAGPVIDQAGNKAPLSYNSNHDKKGLLGGILRFFTRKEDTSYTGVHELGHVLASLAMDESGGNKVWEQHIQEENFVREALNQDEVMSPEERQGLVYHQHTRDSHVAGQINLDKSKLDKKGHTTWYGVTSPAEMFAEAFADVYQYGKKARKASIAILKAYERKAKKMVIIRRLRRLDYAWLLHQLAPDDFPYTDNEDLQRQQINKIYNGNAKVDYRSNNPDLHPRFGEICAAAGELRDQDRQTVAEWDNNMTGELRELGKKYGTNNSIYTNAERDIMRVKLLAGGMFAAGLSLPDLPQMDSKGVNTWAMLYFLQECKDRQQEKVAELDEKKAGEKVPNPGMKPKQDANEPLIPIRDSKAEEPKQPANELLIPIRDSKVEEPKKPEGKPKNINIINENISPRNSISLNRGIAGRNNSLSSSVNDLKILNPKLLTFASAPQKSRNDTGSEGAIKTGNRPKLYNRTELRVMEFVEAIENGEKIVFQLPASTREKLRPWILDRALKAQKTVDDYIKNKKKKGKSK